jgi:hypothetical protein
VLTGKNPKTKFLRQNAAPTVEQHLPKLLAEHHGRGLTFTTSSSKAVEKNLAIFVAVGNPHRDTGLHAAKSCLTLADMASTSTFYFVGVYGNAENPPSAVLGNSQGSRLCEKLLYKTPASLQE